MSRMSPAIARTLPMIPSMCCFSLLRATAHPVVVAFVPRPQHDRCTRFAGRSARSGEARSLAAMLRQSIDLGTERGGCFARLQR